MHFKILEIHFFKKNNPAQIRQNFLKPDRSRNRILEPEPDLAGYPVGSNLNLYVLFDIIKDSRTFNTIH